MSWRVGLHESRAKICCAFTSDGLESRANNSTSRYFLHPCFFKDPAKYTMAFFPHGLNCLHVFFNPASVPQVEIQPRWVVVETHDGLYVPPGLNLRARLHDENKPGHDHKSGHLSDCVYMLARAYR